MAGGKPVTLAGLGAWLHIYDYTIGWLYKVGPPGSGTGQYTVDWLWPV